jgi:hypothetical protein
MNSCETFENALMEKALVYEGTYLGTRMGLKVFCIWKKGVDQLVRLIGEKWK